MVPIIRLYIMKFSNVGFIVILYSKLRREVTFEKVYTVDKDGAGVIRLRYDGEVRAATAEEGLASVCPIFLCDTFIYYTCICVTWLIYVSAMIVSCVALPLRKVSRLCVVCVWHMSTRDMTHLYLWYDLFITGVTWSIHVCDRGLIGLSIARGQGNFVLLQPAF